MGLLFVIFSMANDIDRNREQFRTMNKSAFVLGYTGESGKSLVKELLQSKVFSRVVLIGRREVKYEDDLYKDVVCYLNYITYLFSFSATFLLVLVDQLVVVIKYLTDVYFIYTVNAAPTMLLIFNYLTLIKLTAKKQSFSFLSCAP